MNPKIPITSPSMLFDIVYSLPCKCVHSLTFSANWIEVFPPLEVSEYLVIKNQLLHLHITRSWLENYAVASGGISDARWMNVGHETWNRNSSIIALDYTSPKREKERRNFSIFLFLSNFGTWTTAVECYMATFHTTW